MRYIAVMVSIVGLFILVESAFAAEVSFSVAPHTIPGDTAVIIETHVVPTRDDGGPINALEGRIGFLGDGAEDVTNVIIETGDSVFSLWPEGPHYDASGKIIRFTGGATEALLTEGRIFRMRLFTKGTRPVTISWLGGSAYQADGFGTSVGISSRSIIVTPKSGEPNLIRSTSYDTEPPHIESVLISQDTDLYDGRYFLSVYATDDMTGVSHYEVVEGGITTRVENNGLYEFSNQAMDERVLVTVYDRAGNSISVKVPDEKSYTRLVVLLIVFLMSSILIIRYIQRHMKTKNRRSVQK
jgi:hypothetical protein